jgi:hypothetical protein
LVMSKSASLKLMGWELILRVCLLERGPLRCSNDKLLARFLYKRFVFAASAVSLLIA